MKPGQLNGIPDCTNNWGLHDCINVPKVEKQVTGSHLFTFVVGTKLNETTGTP